ncbi:MAG: hypothetical protein KIT83_22170, partial [Bryobacterales bacterium]|nr:hypothetical protein [Bryobacterales bacterium]
MATAPRSTVTPVEPTAVGNHTPPRSAWWSTEDWTAVWVGAAILAAILLGYRPALPSLKWAGLADLGTVFAPANLLTWL